MKLEKEGDDEFDRRMGNEEELKRVKKDSNTLHTINRRKAN